MFNFNLKAFRLTFIFLTLICSSYIFATVYFIVTNSDAESFIPVGESQIGFENNEFSTIDFDLTGDQNWFLSENDYNTGFYSIQSGSISDNQQSTISLDLNIMESGYMGFYYKVDSEYSTSGNEFYDGLKFYINGVLADEFQPDTNGNSAWRYYRNFVEPGTYNFSWSYIKDSSDGSTFSDNDCAWLDDMFFPLSEPLFYDYYNAPPEQNLSSGLFNAFVHPDNNEHVNMKAKGGTFADFDLDGDLDLYYGYTSSHYFENLGDYFVERNDINNYGIRGIVVGDADNNGYPDILKWRYHFDNDHPHLLLLNKGNHFFQETAYLDSDLLIDLHSQGFIDYDLDGNLDIVAIEKEGSAQFYCFRNMGTNNEGEIIYENIYTYSREDDISSSRTLAIIDFDNDGDQDIYIPRKFEKNWLFINQTLTSNGQQVIYNENADPPFIESSSYYGIDDSFSTESGSSGYGAAWGDYDNDDDFDLYLTNWSKNRLFKNEGENFVNIAENINLESDSLSNGAGWGDFNNDGYMDIWSNNFKREDDLFINPNSSNIEDWDNSNNPYYLSATQDVVPVDYNGDGWLDMFTPGLLMAHDNGIDDIEGYKYTSLLFKNTFHENNNSNNWLILDLEGRKIGTESNGWTNNSNKSAIGARIIVHLNDKSISREIVAGKGHGSMDPLQLHFGLGTNSAIEGITIKWPSRDTLTNQQKISYFDGPIQSNQKLRIVEEIGFVGKKGDVNEDGNVNVIDIVDVVYKILDNNSYSELYLWTCDMDFNNDLNVIDITKLVSFIFLP